MTPGHRSLLQPVPNKITDLKTHEVMPTLRPSQRSQRERALIVQDLGSTICPACKFVMLLVLHTESKVLVILSQTGTQQHSLDQIMLPPQHLQARHISQVGIKNQQTSQTNRVSIPRRQQKIQKFEKREEISAPQELLATRALIPPGARGFGACALAARS